MQVSQFHYQMAARALANGGVIAYPTESVIGLGCDPDNEQAILKLLDIKRRPYQKGLILIASQMKQLEPYVEFANLDTFETIAASWPGPETWIVPKSSSVSPLVYGTHNSIAVRVSAHPGVRALCDAFGGAIISTSANLTGKRMHQELLAVKLRFKQQLDYYLPGKVSGLSAPTRIRHALTGETLRS